MGILSTLLLTPVLGILILALIPSKNTNQIRFTANLTALLAFLLSFWLVLNYDRSDGQIQFYEYFVFNPKLNTALALGVDGLSLPMVVLAALLTVIALLASFNIARNIKSYYVSILLLELGMLGVFLSQDWSLFYIFWELTLAPLFLLIDRWGGTRRHIASLNFVLYTMGGSIFMLISLLAISQYMPPHGGTLMSAMTVAAQSMPRDEQIWVLIGFLIGFGVKMPIFPLHGWLPLAHVEAPSPVSILLSGILLKMGAYGMIRVIVMLPEATQMLQTLLITLALIGMIYGGVLAWRQTDMKAMVAYSSVSHMGIILLDIATMNKTGLIGAVLQMTAHGLVAGAMFLLVGLLYERTHTRNILDYSSLVRVMPRFALFMTITLFAAMGLPGTVGFIAELHAIVGGFQQWGNLMILLGVSIMIGSAYAMRTIGMLFTGPVKPQMRNIEDLKLYELIAAGFLVVLIVMFGLWPAPLIDLSMATMNQMNGTIIQSIQ
ncbi:complex I subunit 4 family protein [Nitrosomonas oligotropha]|uniref:NADH dehydrogenase subunit M n=1 Tax=Nitrosomonas oligotropha TaxID=42354 RepID=A0A1H8MDD6_9PROT|nr:NADH-quinone oxidoreductase subunit M [Nitrosomonas oligotropha]SDW47442.1 NADH dehydrogenase subunit M [Nitrosomonas oligotropha]SEO15349.1 NADH dehydrogenase subunit M [Nitrosomonas oligotropha]